MTGCRVGGKLSLLIHRPKMNLSLQKNNVHLGLIQ